MRFALVFGLVVAGCGQVPQVPQVRDPAVPISSAAVVDWGRMAGAWVEVARFDGAFQRGCGRGGWQIRPGAVSVECPRDGAVVRVDGKAAVIGPGRLRVALAGAAFDIWVLWVDAGYRTVVLGTPDGTMGWILDRSVASSPDRIRAAQEILDFNGYDLGALKKGF